MDDKNLEKPIYESMYCGKPAALVESTFIEQCPLCDANVEFKLLALKGTRGEAEITLGRRLALAENVVAVARLVVNEGTIGQLRRAIARYDEAKDK